MATITAVNRSKSAIKLFSVLIDLSGTLHIEDAAIEGALEAIAKLRSIPGNRVTFVTNTTKESGRVLHERLQGLEFGIKRSEIVTSLTAARKYVVDHALRPMLFIEDIAMEDFADIETDDPNCVLVGLAPSHFHYDRLNEAFRLLMDKPDSKLIAVHKGRYLRKTNGLALGPGAFVSALEYSTGKNAVVVGKPEQRFFLEALNMSSYYNLDYSFMIGDDVRDDVDGAQKAGLKGILVQTGKYRNGDENLINPPPWYLATSIVDAVDRIEQFICFGT